MVILLLLPSVSNKNDVLQQQPEFVHQFYTDSNTMIRVDGESTETASAIFIFMLWLSAQEFGSCLLIATAIASLQTNICKLKATNPYQNQPRKYRMGEKQSKYALAPHDAAVWRLVRRMLVMEKENELEKEFVRKRNPIPYAVWLAEKGIGINSKNTVQHVHHDFNTGRNQKINSPTNGEIKKSKNQDGNSQIKTHIGEITKYFHREIKERNRQSEHIMKKLKNAKSEMEIAIKDGTTYRNEVCSYWSEVRSEVEGAGRRRSVDRCFKRDEASVLDARKKKTRDELLKCRPMEKCRSFRAIVLKNRFVCTERPVAKKWSTRNQRKVEKRTHTSMCTLAMSIKAGIIQLGIYEANQKELKALNQESSSTLR
ncbi:hypothetical protein LXL04_001038 [Taraxacum kok-saghyz]